jgi:hypothetical protein
MLDLRRSLSDGSILTTGSAIESAMLSVERYSRHEVVVWRGAIKSVVLLFERGNVSKIAL